MLRLVLRIYFDALFKGNPFAVVPTLIAVAALSLGVFYEGVSKRDPVAIGLMIGVGVLFTIVLVVAIVDRKMNPPKKRPTAAGKSKGGGVRAGR